MENGCILDWGWFYWGEQTQANSCTLESEDLGIMKAQGLRGRGSPTGKWGHFEDMLPLTSLRPFLSPWDWERSFASSEFVGKFRQTNEGCTHMINNVIFFFFRSKSASLQIDGFFLEKTFHVECSFATPILPIYLYPTPTSPKNHTGMK